MVQSDGRGGEKNIIIITTTTMIIIITSRCGRGEPCGDGQGARASRVRFFWARAGVVAGPRGSSARIVVAVRHLPFFARHGIARIRRFSRSRPRSRATYTRTAYTAAAAAAAASAGTCPPLRGPPRRAYKTALRPLHRQQFTSAHRTERTTRVSSPLPSTDLQTRPYRSDCAYHTHSSVIIFSSSYQQLFEMAYLSNSFDFEHLQNSTNWQVVQKKRSFVARKMHKINKVSVVSDNSCIFLHYFGMQHRTARLTELFFFSRLLNRYSEHCAAETP